MTEKITQKQALQVLTDARNAKLKSFQEKLIALQQEYGIRLVVQLRYTQDGRTQGDIIATEIIDN